MKKNIYPPMHTAEHILNQSMHRLFGSGRCFSSHIEKKKSKCDYRFSRELKRGELDKLEAQVNRIIDSDLPVMEKYVTKEEAEKIYASFGIKGLPDNNTERYRTIKVGSYDEILCTGPHVESTKQVGRFKIISTSYAEGILRIRYKLINH